MIDHHHLIASQESDRVGLQLCGGPVVEQPPELLVRLYLW
jgi:hypothetical protein